MLNKLASPHKPFTRITALSCMALVMACANKYAVEPTPLETIENVQADVRSIWDRDLGTSFDENINNIDLAISQNSLFAVNGKGTISALNIKTGTTVWKQSAPDDITGGVGSGYGTVVGVTEEGVVIALAADSGETLWQHDIQAEVYAAPVVDADYVYVQTVDNQVFAIDRTDGSRVWNYSQSMPLISLWGSSQPQLFNDWLVSGLANGKLVAINKMTGQEEWERPIGVAKGSSDLEQLADIDGQFIIKDGMLWAASYQENLIAMSLLDGGLQWYQPISSFTDLAFSDGTLLVADNHSVITALSAYSGETFWQTEALKGRKVHALAAYESFVLAVDFEGYLHVINKTTGEIVKRQRIDKEGLVAAPKIIDGVAYLLTRGSELMALRIVDLNALAAETSNEESASTTPFFSQPLFAVPDLDSSSSDAN